MLTELALDLLGSRLEAENCINSLHKRTLWAEKNEKLGEFGTGSANFLCEGPDNYLNILGRWVVGGLQRLNYTTTLDNL